MVKPFKDKNSTFFMLQKLRKNKWIFRSIIQSIFFNLYYLPFKQAIKLPILLYKPHFIKLKGKIIIDSPIIKTGMIQLGINIVPIYPNNGIVYENNGGLIEFKGPCRIGNNSAISIGERAKVIIGKNFQATSTLKIISCHYIAFGQNTLIGWECTFMDTDFHKMKRLNGDYTTGYASIIIGNNNWFGTKCLIMKRTETPDYCTISAASLLNKKYNYPPYSIIGGNPASDIAHNIYRDLNNDIPTYHEFK